MAISDAITSGENWEPCEFHGIAVRGRATPRYWRKTLAGIEVQGEPELRRTRGQPLTMRRLCDNYLADIQHLDLVETPTALAIIATESRGVVDAAREEPKIKDWSFGMMQTLTSTARAMFVLDPPVHVDLVKYVPLSVPAAKRDFDYWRALLTQPRFSLYAGLRYAAVITEQFQLKHDPVLVYAGYNSGTPRPGNTPWGLVYYGTAMEHFVAWYNDACAVLKERGLR